MRAWLLLIAYVVALVVASASAGQVSQAMRPRWLQAIVYRQFTPAGSWAVRKAYCIVGRESQWHARAISPTGDYGLFQWNYATWHRVLDWSRILDPVYNTWAAWHISRHGTDWSPWAGGRYPC